MLEYKGMLASEFGAPFVERRAHGNLHAWPKRGYLAVAYYAASVEDELTYRCDKHLGGPFQALSKEERAR